MQASAIRVLFRNDAYVHNAMTLMYIYSHLQKNYQQNNTILEMYTYTKVLDIQNNPTKNKDKLVISLFTFE